MYGVVYSMENRCDIDCNIQCYKNSNVRCNCNNE